MIFYPNDTPASDTPTRLWPPCPFCWAGELTSIYTSVGTTIYCESCHGQFTFPAFEREVGDMWKKGGSRISHELTTTRLQLQAALDGHKLAMDALAAANACESALREALSWLVESCDNHRNADIPIGSALGNARAALATYKVATE
jgi:hypothetical protein